MLPTLRHFMDSTYNRYGDYYQTPYGHQNVIRPRSQTSAHSKSDPSKFQVMLNVKQFRPDEIDIKTVDNFVVVHCKHQEQADDHGFVSREFTRRYQLPDNVQPEKVKSSISKDGVLTIEAPRKALEPPSMNERIVPIAVQQHGYFEAQNEKEKAYRAFVESEQLEIVG